MRFKMPASARRLVAGGAAAAIVVAAALATLAVPRAFAQSPSGITNGELPGESANRPSRVTINGNTMAAKVVAIVMPAYPKSLQDAHVSGSVILSAVIAKDGSVKDLKPLSGPEQLQPIAVQAVKQWRYQPTSVEGAPVEVSTTISIKFTPGKAPRYEQQGAAMPLTAEAIDPQLRADILRLIAATHLKKIMRDYGTQVMETMRPSIEDSLPRSSNHKQILDEIQSKMLAALQSDAATDNIVMVYAKYLSDDDVKGAASFYESPAGQRFNSVSTQMEDDLSQSGEQFALDNLNVILKGVCASHPEIQGKADFCQKNSHEHSASLPRQAPGGPSNAQTSSGN
ncbi:MAG TPA: TonB family protein [Candidatus Dormibacteraeota bacterium]|nr:TonB family protein [Candidatus Dormibacteraeota bacterium]